LEKGQNVTTKALGAGRHVLTVRVSDGNATTVSGEVRITVVKAPEPAGPEMTLLAAVVMIVLAVAVAAVIAWRRSRRGA
jgi:hypothetical protein